MLKVIWKVLRETLGKLGGRDSIDYLLKDNIVVLRGKISKETGSVQISYPERIK